MSALDSVPTNQSLLNPTSFLFKAKRLPTTVFFSQKVSIPSLQLQPIKISNPLNKLNIPGDHLDFGAFNVHFKIDEDMKNYSEIFLWMIAIGFPDNYEEYAAINAQPKVSGEWIMSDASTIVFDGQNNPKISINYKNVFPIALAANEFDATDSNINYMSATATFVCESFNFSPIV